MSIRCIAFDCFGTVFDMRGVSREEISDYVRHVRANDFSPYTFPNSWYELPLHPDSAEGVAALQAAGYQCVALSNGSVDLLRTVSERGGIQWNHIVDLSAHGVHKPHRDAYLTLERDLGVPPHETLMVTGNPAFGDVEGAASVGMQAAVIRQADVPPKTILQLADLLTDAATDAAEGGEK